MFACWEWVIMAFILGGFLGAGVYHLINHHMWKNTVRDDGNMRKDNKR